jgi:hypothetical protein
MYTSRKVMGEIRKTSAPGEPNSTNNRPTARMKMASSG